MTPFELPASIVVVALAAAGGLGWLQWLMLKRLLRRPGRWTAASTIAAAASTPLSTALLLDLLARAGLPPQAALPVGMGLLAAHFGLGTLAAAGVAWALGHLGDTQQAGGVRRQDTKTRGERRKA